MRLLRRPRPTRPRITGRGAGVRLGTWPSDATVGHLVILDHDHVPAEHEIDRLVHTARERGLRAIRTGALFPEAAEELLDRGFTRLDSLTLLERRLDEPGVPEHRTGRVRHPTVRDDTVRDDTVHDDTVHDDTVHVRRMGITQDAAAAAVDRLAFGPLWGYDRRTVTEVRRATPAHRARRVGSRRHLDAYAISGAGGTTGYLQRLAVRPDRHRRGLASALVADSLRWMIARGLDSALVNTASDNHAALALYDRFGFRPLPRSLTVAELLLDPAGGGQDIEVTELVPPTAP